MSKSRSAEATIKGFNYQFAATILLILNAGNNDQITVEGIEDVDVIGANRLDAVQCKYYEGTKLTNSVLREIVEPMLKDFAGRQTKITYHIYGHFKDVVNFPLADANQFKTDVLSYRQGSGNNLVIGNLADDLALDNAALATFLQHLKFKYTSDYESHKSEVMQVLRVKLECSQIDAECFYYPNAFSLVADLGTKSTDAERTIRRSVFLSRINSKQIVFKQWLLDEKSEAQFCKAMRIRFFSPANTSPFARFFVIECDGAETVHALKGVALEIRKKWSSHTKSKRSVPANRYAPYILLRHVAPSTLTETKAQLYAEGVSFVDGYPFSSSPFEPEHINQDQTFENQISLRILHDENELAAALAGLKARTKEIYEFYKTKPVPLAADIKRIQIPITGIELVTRII